MQKNTETTNNTESTHNIQVIILGVIGSKGKLGSSILQAIESQSLLESNATSSTDSIHYKYIDYKYIECLRGEDFNEKCPQADVWIDASDNELAFEHIHVCQKHNKPILICTTGPNTKQTYIEKTYREQILSNKSDDTNDSDTYINTNTNTYTEPNTPIMFVPTIPIMFVPNTSLAFAHIRALLKHFSDWKTIIGDTHFHTKKDTPAGTTKDLMQFMNVESTFSIRNQINGAKMQLFLDNMDESIEISYTTYNRLPYAKGAILLATWLLQRMGNNIEQTNSKPSKTFLQCTTESSTDIYTIEDYIKSVDNV